MRWWVAVGLMMVGCGREKSLTATSALPLPTFHVTALRTGAPVHAAVVLNGGRVTVTAPGFLPRQQDASVSEVRMWEDDAILPANVTYTLVYQQSRELERPAQRNLTLSVAPQFEQDRHISQVIEASREVINAETPYSLSFGEPAYLEIVSGNGGAFTEVTVGSEGITHAKISFDPAGYWGPHLQRVITHEMGHALGLADCVLSGMMMCGPDPVHHFTSQEQEVMRKMLARDTGNVPPDDAPVGVGVKMYKIFCGVGR